VPPVEPNRGGPIPRGQRAPKLVEVGLDLSGIQPQRVWTEDQVFGKLLPEGVEELFQGVPGMLGPALRPEKPHDLVASESAFTAPGEEREQGQPAALGDRRLAAGRIHQSEAAEHFEPEHGPPMSAGYVEYGGAR
jgi:hypothetical protein